MSNYAVAERETGQYPLSIATSLALEAATGIHPEIQVSRPPILGYRELWVNLRTLYRNLMGSIPREFHSTLLPQPIAEAIVFEMEQIVGIINDSTNAMTHVVFYVSDYKDIERKYSLATVRRDNTEKQKEYTALQNQVIQQVLDATTNADGFKVLCFDLRLKPTNRVTTLILTHYPYDLIAYKEFGELHLLESHTGAIKKRAQWYTKYLGGKDLPMIPFTEGFLQIFGDAETFRPMDIRLRRDIIEVATKYRWSATTTREKINYSIEQLRNPYFREIIRKILG